MKLHQIALLSAASAMGFVATACSSDTGPHINDPGPIAYVRYVNAIPDTNQTDFRFVDQVTGSPWFGQAFFRDISSYEPTAPGARHIRVFAVDPNAAANFEGDINLVSQRFVDTTITLEANSFYTIVHAGYARTGATPAQHLIVIKEDRGATLSGDQIGVRAINAAPTIPSADVYAAASPSGSPAFSSVAFGDASPYDVMSTGAVTFSTTPAGSSTVAASAAAPAGAPPASISQSALGGYSVAGSLLTAFIFPPAVAGSMATLAANANCSKGKCANASVVWMQDNYPQMPTSTP
jgi:uncharacterized protein DUF4397